MMTQNNPEGGYLIPDEFVHGGWVKTPVARTGIFPHFLRWLGLRIGLIGQRFGAWLYYQGMTEETEWTEGLLYWYKKQMEKQHANDNP